MNVSLDITKEGIDRLRYGLFDGRRISADSLTPEEVNVLKEVYGNETKPSRKNTTSDEQYYNRLDYWTPINLAGLIVDKVASLLYSRGVNRQVTDELLQAKMKSIYLNKETSMLLMAKLASLGGYSAVRLHRNWLGEYTFNVFGLDDVHPMLNAQNPFGPVDGVIFSTVADANDIQYKTTKGVVEVTEIITRNQRDAQGRIVTPGVHKLFYNRDEQDLGFKGVNPLGDFLGVVWCRNVVHPNYAYGKSDILPLVNLVNQINELITDGIECAVFGVHSPIITDAPKDKISWKYSPRSILHAPKDTITRRLESGINNLSQLEEYLQFLLNNFHLTSRIPSVAVGDLKNIGALSSGRAYQIAMTPAKELITEKEFCAKEYEKEICKELVASMLYYGDLPGGFSAEKVYKLTESFTVEFEPLNMFEEEEVTIADESLTSQVSGNIRSQRDAVRVLHPDWSKDEIDLEVTQINAEKAESTDALEEEKLRQIRERLNNE
jgi:hypothetical protein